MFYRFRLSRVSIAATPKTGSTSVLTFLLNLEEQLESSEAVSPPNAGGFAPRSADGGPSGDPPLNLVNRLKRFAISAETPIAEREVRLAIVRDPAERIASCWLDKLVDAPAVWQAKYFAENWFPSDFRTPDAIEASFSAFLEALHGDHALLHSDPHWAPQSWMLRHWEAARWVTTEELTDLPRVIIERLDPLPEVPPMPRKHRTETWLKQFLLTLNTESLVREIYSADYAFLAEHCENSSMSRHATHAGFDAEDALKLPAFDREVHLRRTRTLSRSLATILESSVWRRRFDAHDQQA